MAIAVVGLAVGILSPDPPDGSLVEYDNSFRSEFAIVLVFLRKGICSKQLFGYNQYPEGYG